LSLSVSFNRSYQSLQDSEWILSRFQGERWELLRAIFEHSRTAKIWTRPDIRAITGSYGTNKRRVLLALEYLDEKGWIQLQRQRSVEVFAVLKRAFDVEEQSERLYRIMKEREAYELERIRRMVEFFESGTCLSSGLSAYFGQEGVEACGLCSACASGKATLETTAGRPPLHTFDFRKITAELSQTEGLDPTPGTTIRFLCGISSPIATRFRLYGLDSFGLLEGYPYREVADWVGREISR